MLKELDAVETLEVGLSIVLPEELGCAVTGTESETTSDAMRA